MLDAAWNEARSPLSGLPKLTGSATRARGRGARRPRYHSATPPRKGGEDGARSMDVGGGALVGLAVAVEAVKERYESEEQECGTHPAHDHNRERALRFGPDFRREGGRQEAQNGGERGHRDRADSPFRPFDDRVEDRRADAPEAVER